MLGGIGAPRASGEEVTTTTEVRPVAWRVVFVSGRYSITLGVETGTCDKPSIDHISVRWAPERQGRPRAFVTVYERRTIVHYPPTPGVKYVCAGVGLLLTKRIKLARPVSESSLYDGSTNPSQRRAVCPRRGPKSALAPPGGKYKCLWP
jgi:hypothetical protein